MASTVDITEVEKTRQRLELLLARVSEDQPSHAGLDTAECVAVLNGYINTIELVKDLHAKLNRVVSCR